MNSHNHVSGQGPRMGLLPYPPSSFDPDCNDFPFDESMDSCPVPGTNMGSGVGPGLGVNSGSGPCFPMNIPGGDSRFGIPNSGKNMPFCDSRPLMMEAMRMDVDDRFPPVNEEIWDTGK